MNRIFPVLIVVVILLFFSVNSAFGQCGLPGTPPCPKKQKPVTTPANPKPKQPKKQPPQTRFVPRAPNIELVKIPAGSFMMGSNDGDENEKPVHRVNIGYSFYMGKYEITQKQWKAIMGNNPSDIKGDNLPVEEVSWNRAKEFIRKLNKLQNDYEYRLPTEAEWEYACRAGTSGDYAGNIDLMAWHDENSGKPVTTHPVGQKQPNAFGLYDMHGNVCEWVEDIYNSSYIGLPIDGSANLSIGDTNKRIRRGGVMYMPAKFTRSANRADTALNDYHDFYVGFRVAARLR